MFDFLFITERVAATNLLQCFPSITSQLPFWGQDTFLEAIKWWRIQKIHLNSAPFRWWMVWRNTNRTLAQTYRLLSKTSSLLLHRRYRGVQKYMVADNWCFIYAVVHSSYTYITCTKPATFYTLETLWNMSESTMPVTWNFFSEISSEDLLQ